MALVTERIEEGFQQEYEDLVRAGLEKFLAQGLGAILWEVYRRGYVRGHSERSREYQQEARANLPLAVKYEGDKLLISGVDVTPSR